MASTAHARLHRFVDDVLRRVTSGQAVHMGAAAPRSIAVADAAG